MKYDLHMSYTTKVNDNEEKSIRHNYKKMDRQETFDKAAELFKDIPSDAVGLYISIDENWDSKMSGIEI
jgi:hypothetical protein